MTHSLMVLLALAAADPSAGKALRVLTYNIHHGEGTDGKIDLPRLAKLIRDADPDLVAVQEVDNKCRRSGGVDQTAELAKLTKLHGKFAKAIDYDGGEYGQAILSATPLSDLKIDLLPGTPDRERRIAASARVTAAGRDVIFVTTHLHHAKPEFREQQVAELRKLFDAADRPVILAGDFNALPAEKPIATMGEAWHRHAEKPDPSYPAEKPVKPLDYILVRKADKFRFVGAKVMAETVASDHRPVFAVLEWVGP